MTVFIFVFKRFFRKKSNLFLLLVLPIASVFLPTGEWLPIPIGFQYYGLLLLFIASKLCGIIMEDRTNKVLLRLGVAPITHFQYLLQNLLAYSLIMTIVNIVVIITGIIVHGENLVGPFWLLLIYTFFTMTAISFSLAWYSLFRDKEAAFSVLGGFIILLGMLGGILWPVFIMPELFQRLAMLLPTYWFAEAVMIVSFGGSLNDLALTFVMMLLFAVAFLLLGSRRGLS